MKYLRFFVIIPLIILTIILINGFSKRSKDYDLVFAVTDKIDYLSNPSLKVKPIKTKLTKEQVAQTSKGRPCLFIYDNKIYQIPDAFFDLHKGGSGELLQACGSDITAIFNFIPHTTSAQQLLSHFYYTDLKN